MKRISFVLVLGIVSVSLATGMADAKEMKISGSIRYAVTDVDNGLANAGDRQFVSQRLVGKIESDDKAGPLQGSDQVCFGTVVVEKQQLVASHGYCMAVDEDRDAWWLTYSAGPESSQWTVTGGVGKYAGMTGSGTTVYKSDNASMMASQGWAQTFAGTLNLP